MNRIEFLRSLGLITVSTAAGGTFLSSCAGKQSSETQADTTATAETAKPKELFFKISLAEWSLHKTLFEGKLTNLDFPAKAKNDFGISAVEYVNQFFKDKAKDQPYLADLKKRCDDNGVTSVLIMIDGEGGLGDTNKTKRNTAVENHKKWVDAAKFLGCHSIRVNAYGEGSREEVAKAATDGLRALSEFAKGSNINVIVENHGGYSSDGQWLSQVISNTQMQNCGTLPDFGNFCLVREKDTCKEEYDRYKGITEMMPFAKGVSAKAHEFDAQGNCIETDYTKMLPIVKSAGYTGYIGIEYEGSRLSEDEGIRATKALLERVGMMV
ncbi:sugar phosphate isomerase/epimerase [Fulvivirgaceae bacterium PWU4]|uniref:Sugar phosphate isomerase/epimerase n=1 Tax=Chryseosolibacter histidini TaxID=2782349 RepID=A0AAP2GQ57_9BACT|nr:sugar phosphate isomerase/epimerase family protein [Chryseosolibacter histidini]MBT1698605.1 sugar phosphate isomerase/epimerase [Chryseosolibacter histidini]